MTRLCKTCEFWEPADETHLACDPYSENYCRAGECGDCHRFPPKPDPCEAPDGSICTPFSWGYPVTHPDSWCGEWSPATDWSGQDANPREDVERAIQSVKDNLGYDPTALSCAILTVLTKLTPEQRLDLFSRFCKYCGCVQPQTGYCQCHNDE